MWSTILKRFSFWLAVGGVVLAIVFMSKTNVAEPMPEVPFPPPQKPVDHAIAASGLVEAFGENVSIGVPVSALVSSVKVKVWDRVKSGDLLLQLDDRELRARRLVEETRVAELEAAVSRVEEQLTRLQSVTDAGAVSREVVSTKTADLRVVEAEKASAVAAVAQTDILLGRLSVTAPRDGTILQVNVRAGEFVQAGPADPPIMLGDLDYYQVRADIDEQLAPQIREGVPAAGYLKGDTAHPLSLEFVRIEPFVIPKVSLTGASNERVDTRVLQVIYRIKAGPGVRLYPGQQMDLYLGTTTLAPLP
jgi:RND family efflux transporter MFP subunit